MAAELDAQTIDRLRSMTPRQAFDEARAVVYRLGAVGSEDFLDIYEQLVSEGILSWDQIEAFDV